MVGPVDFSVITFASDNRAITPIRAILNNMVMQMEEELDVQIREERMELADMLGLIPW